LLGDCHRRGPLMSSVAPLIRVPCRSGGYDAFTSRSVARGVARGKNHQPKCTNTYRWGIAMHKPPLVVLPSRPVACGLGVLERCSVRSRRGRTLDCSVLSLPSLAKSCLRSRNSEQYSTYCISRWYIVWNSYVQHFQLRGKANDRPFCNVRASGVRWGVV